MNLQRLKLLATLSISVTALNWPAVYAVDDIAMAEKLYKKGDYESASHCLFALLRANPNNGTAHYLLGNTLINLKRRDEAVKEYEKAVQSDPKGTAGLYSQEALANLLKSPRTVDYGKANQSVELDEKNSLRRSVKAISNETSESQRNNDIEFKQKVAEINRLADEQISRLRTEMQERIDANGVAQYAARLSRRGVYLGSVETYNPAEENEAVRAEFNPKIEAVQEDRDRRIHECTQAHTSKAEAIEDPSLKLEQQYLDHNRTTGVKLTPKGTNRYTRSYETADEPSGAQVPVQAAPAKSLR